MATKGSFEKAIKSVGFRNATQQLTAVNFADEFAKRGIKINSGNFDSGLDK